MKRRDLIKRIARQAKAQGVSWELKREGANHAVYNLNGSMIPVPRHSEISDKLAYVIFKQCEQTLGKEWWM